MPKYKFPIKEYWDVDYENDRAATIVEAFNLDLHRFRNKAGTSVKLYPHTVQLDASITVAPGKFLYSNWNGSFRYTAIANKVFLTANAFTIFSADTLTSTPTSITNAEAIVHGRSSTSTDILVVATGTDLARFNKDVSATAWEPNWWTDVTASGGVDQDPLSNSYPTILKTFGNAPALFILNGRNLHSIGTPGTATNPTLPSDVIANRLVFKDGYSGVWMATLSDRIFVGLLNAYGSGAPSLIEEYNPFTETVREYVIQEGETRGYVYGNQLVVIDIKGNVREFNGSDFPISAKLPTATLQERTMTLPHRNGFCVWDGMPQFLFPDVGARDYIGGMWEFNPLLKRIYHRTSPSKNLSFGEGYATGSWGAMFCENNVLYAGCHLSDQATSGDVVGIWSNLASNTAEPAGLKFNFRSWFVTGKIAIDTINAVWRNLLIKYNPRTTLGAQSGTIVAKYRTMDIKTTGFIDNGTWVDTLNFTVSNAAAARIEIGNEIQITRGRGSGFCAHAVTLTPSAGVTWVTLDEAFPATITGDFSYLVNNWIKIPQTITSNTQQSKLLDIPSLPTDISATISDNPSEWLEFKIETRELFYVEELQVGVEPNLKVEN